MELRERVAGAGEVITVTVEVRARSPGVGASVVTRWYNKIVNAAERKAARAGWEGRVFRGGWEEMADYDALFWDRIPVDARAEAVWELSKELHEISHPETHERRLPRSAYRLERR